MTEPDWDFRQRLDGFNERWVHHCQIARATGHPEPTDPSFVVPAVAAVMRGFPGAMAMMDVPPASEVSLVLGDTGAAWTLVEGGGAWTLHDGLPAEPMVRLDVSVDVATRMFSRALTSDEILGSVAATGSGDLPAVLAAGLAAFFGRS